MTTTLTPTATPVRAESSSAADSSSRRTRRGLVAVTATAGAGATWMLGSALGADMVIEASGQKLDFVTTTSATFMAALAGWAGLALLERFTRRAVAIWTAVALVITATSFVPVSQAEASAATMTLLVVWHVVAGGVIIEGLRRTARQVRS